jgi:hypothetical protein
VEYAIWWVVVKGPLPPFQTRGDGLLLETTNPGGARTHRPELSFVS